DGLASDANHRVCSGLSRPVSPCRALSRFVAKRLVCYLWAFSAAATAGVPDPVLDRRRAAAELSRDDTYRGAALLVGEHEVLELFGVGAGVAFGAGACVEQFSQLLQLRLGQRPPPWPTSCHSAVTVTRTRPP